MFYGFVNRILYTVVYLMLDMGETRMIRLLVCEGLYLRLVNPQLKG